MKIKYIEWGKWEEVNESEVALYSLEPNPKIIASAEELLDSYLSEDVDVYEKFNQFKSTISGELQQLKIGHQLEDPELNDLVVEVEWIIEDPLHDEPDYVRAQLMTYAIMISARTGFLFLSDNHKLNYLDPRDIVHTNESWTLAEISMEQSRERLLGSNLSGPLLTTHGVGCTSSNENTLTAESHYWKNIKN